MSLSFNSSIPGIRAATNMLNTSAHNIANSNTDGYKKQHVNLKSDHGGGVIAEIAESTERGSRYKNKRGDTVETSKCQLYRRSCDADQGQTPPIR